LIKPIILSIYRLINKKLISRYRLNNSEHPHRINTVGFENFPFPAYKNNNFEIIFYSTADVLSLKVIDE